MTAQSIKNGTATFAVRAAALATTLGIAGASLAVVGPPERAGDAQVGGGERSGDRDGRRESGRQWGRGEGDPKRMVEAMRESGMSLEKAIATAEQQFKGRAINAHCARGMPGDAPAIEVTVLDESGRLMVAVIDVRGGTVRSTRAASMDDFAVAGSVPIMILKASEVGDCSVVDGQTRTVGSIDELIIDEARGRIAYAIVDVEGSSDRKVVVPWTALRHEQGVYRLGLQGSTLAQAPRHEAAKWSTLATDEFARQVGSFYGQSTYGSDMALESGVPLTFVKLSDVIGMDIQGTDKTKLGDIEDLAFDPVSGRIAYAALSFGGFLGFNDKLFAVPWDALKSRKDGSVVLAIDKARLKDAPGFDKAHWPTTANEQFDEEVRTFYRKRTAAATE
jgi:sporulation protein YlmC with PRC-barrel domain